MSLAARVFRSVCEAQEEDSSSVGSVRPLKWLWCASSGRAPSHARAGRLVGHITANLTSCNVDPFSRSSRRRRRKSSPRFPSQGGCDYVATTKRVISQPALMSGNVAATTSPRRRRRNCIAFSIKDASTAVVHPFSLLQRRRFPFIAMPNSACCCVCVSAVVRTRDLLLRTLIPALLLPGSLPLLLLLPPSPVEVPRLPVCASLPPRVCPFVRRSSSSFSRRT